MNNYTTIVYVDIIPDSKVHGANMEPIWGRQDPGGPHVGPMNLALLDHVGAYAIHPILQVLADSCCFQRHEGMYIYSELKYSLWMSWYYKIWYHLLSYQTILHLNIISIKHFVP